MCGERGSKKSRRTNVQSSLQHIRTTVPIDQQRAGFARESRRDHPHALEPSPLHQLKLAGASSWSVSFPQPVHKLACHACGTTSYALCGPTNNGWRATDHAAPIQFLHWRAEARRVLLWPDAELFVLLFFLAWIAPPLAAFAAAYPSFAPVVLGGGNPYACPLRNRLSLLVVFLLFLEHLPLTAWLAHAPASDSSRTQEARLGEAREQEISPCCSPHLLRFFNAALQLRPVLGLPAFRSVCSSWKPYPTRSGLLAL